MKNIWNKIKEWLLAIPSKYLLGFIFGLIITSLFVIVVPGAIEWCMAPIVTICIICAFIDAWNIKPFRWKLWLSIILGTGVIQLFVVL